MRRHAIRIGAAEVADALASALRSAAESLDDEHATWGLDSRDELALHPILADGLIAAGFEVAREVRYPGGRSARKLSDGIRCDLVLTPAGHPLAEEPSRATLFDNPDAVDPADALWLEVKICAQFIEGLGNPRWTGQLGRPLLNDVRKLARDKEIVDAMLVVVLFAAESAIAEHDHRMFLDRCLDESLPIGSPVTRWVPITERHGNAGVFVAATPVRHSPPGTDDPRQHR